MKTIRQWNYLFIIFLIASACAATPSTIPEKYNLANQLENVSNISRQSLMNWDVIDNQSFILQTGPSNYYLVILESKANRLPFVNSLDIIDTNSFIRPSYSNVIVNDDGWEDSYTINKIYKFKDYSQVEEIKTRLSYGK